MVPRFYPIIDTAVCMAGGFEPARVARACLLGGATLLQLRDKTGATGALVALADEVVRLARASGARVIINDRVDVALMARADGVHVGQGDLPVATARHLIGDAALVGLSTHSRGQADEALRTPASYVAVGPVFGTRTKDTGYEARGLDLVRQAAGRGKPVVAIGGITFATAREVIDAGADSVAVISDLLAGGDAEARTRAYLALLG